MQNLCTCSFLPQDTDRPGTRDLLYRGVSADGCGRSLPTQHGRAHLGLPRFAPLVAVCRFRVANNYTNQDFEVALASAFRTGDVCCTEERHICRDVAGTRFMNAINSLRQRHSS